MAFPAEGLSATGSGAFETPPRDTPASGRLRRFLRHRRARGMHGPGDQRGYQPRLHALGAELIVEAPKRLMTFAATLDCPMTIVERGAPLPAPIPYLFCLPIQKRY